MTKDGRVENRQVFKQNVSNKMFLHKHKSEDDAISFFQISKLLCEKLIDARTHAPQPRVTHNGPNNGRLNSRSFHAAKIYRILIYVSTNIFITKFIYKYSK